MLLHSLQDESSESLTKQQSSNSTVQALSPTYVSLLEDAQQEIIRLHQQQGFTEKKLSILEKLSEMIRMH